MKHLAAMGILFLAIVVGAKAECDEVMCSRYCANGFKKSADGCNICDCCDEVMCSRYCANGFKKNADGCNICDCCDEVMCNIYCEYGFKKNADGCDICDCNEQTEIRDGQCPVVSSSASGICEEACKHDGSCPTGQKCCSNGCGHACVAALNMYSVRDGSCPARKSLAVGVGTCANECSNDSECSGSQKCCANSCGATVCTDPEEEKPGSCPAGQLPEGTLGLCAELCDGDSDCPALQKCCSNGCGRVCVTPNDVLEIHAGSCPAVNVTGTALGACGITCDNDGSCEDTEKCCLNNCGGYACIAAIEIPPKCPDVACFRWCAYGFKTDDNGCDICDCLEEPTEIHEGECPVEKSDDFGMCIEACGHDGDCESAEKCCSNGCGHLCMESIQRDEPECPINAYPEEPLGTCDEGCSDHIECNPNELCCSNGCGHDCVELVTVHDGQCPTGLLQLGWSGVCVEMCNNDGQCATNQKCCSNGCGHVCVTVEQKRPGCPDVVCQIFCEYGNKKDNNGCPICECEDPKSGGVERPGECPVGFLPEGVVGTCDEQCSSDSECTSGQKCCSNGCGHVCIKAINVESPCPPVLCTRYCENGMKKDDNGCEICQCNEEKTCDAVFCQRHCSYGYKQDENGCNICDCKDKPEQCEASICADFCIHGYERDANGCEVCTCTSQVSALIQKEGSCPAEVEELKGQNCPDMCDIDDECPDDKKCCFDGCSNVCRGSGSSATALASPVIVLVGSVFTLIAMLKL